MDITTFSKMTAAQKREEWTARVWELIRELRPFEAIEMMTWWPMLGRARGWKSAGAWFDAALSDTEAPRWLSLSQPAAHWLAVQGMIWFSREA